MVDLILAALLRKGRNYCTSRGIVISCNSAAVLGAEGMSAGVLEVKRFLMVEGSGVILVTQSSTFYPSQMSL